MSDEEILEKLKKLPKEMKEEIELKVDYMLKEVESKSSGRTKLPLFGALKGQVKMAEDFDDPLEDFKDYM